MTFTLCFLPSTSTFFSKPFSVREPHALPSFTTFSSRHGLGADQVEGEVSQLIHIHPILKPPTPSLSPQPHVHLLRRAEAKSTATHPTTRKPREKTPHRRQICNLTDTPHHDYVLRLEFAMRHPTAAEIAQTPSHVDKRLQHISTRKLLIPQRPPVAPLVRQNAVSRRRRGGGRCGSTT